MDAEEQPSARRLEANRQRAESLGSPRPGRSHSQRRNLIDRTRRQPWRSG